MIQRSVVTAKAIFPPRVMAPGSGETELEWVQASGRGVVQSFTVVPQRPPQADYNICLIDLEEGPRLMSRLVGVDHQEIAIGLAVEAVIEGEGDDAVLLFRPSNAGGAS
jgi:uncharacterized OB-fold protein